MGDLHQLSRVYARTEYDRFVAFALRGNDPTRIFFTVKNKIVSFMTCILND